jgi:hypothetical protein
VDEASKGSARTSGLKPLPAVCRPHFKHLIRVDSSSLTLDVSPPVPSVSANLFFSSLTFSVLLIARDPAGLCQCRLTRHLLFRLHQVRCRTHFQTPMQTFPASLVGNAHIPAKKSRNRRILVFFDFDSIKVNYDNDLISPSPQFVLHIVFTIKQSNSILSKRLFTVTTTTIRTVHKSYVQTS